MAKAKITALNTIKEVLEWIIKTFFNVSLFFDSVHSKIERKIVKELHEDATFAQYANRLIEYVDADDVVEAYFQFASLVQSGFDVNYAFEVIINGYSSVDGFQC